MKKRILFSIIIVISGILKSQNLPYLNASTGNVGEYIVDIDSNIYMFNGNIIKKLDKNFNPIWINKYGSLSFRNLLLSKYNSMYFIATNTVSGNGSIGKINANGNISWCKEGILPDQMLLDRNNNLLLSLKGINSFGTTMLVKLDTSGNLIKARVIETAAIGYISSAYQSVILNDSAGIYTVCSWGNAFEGPVNGVLYKYVDSKDSIIKSTLIPISYMGNTGQYSVSSVSIIKSKRQSDAFYITQSTSAANQSFNCTFYVTKYNTNGKLWGIQFQTYFPYLVGAANIEEDSFKNIFVTFMDAIPLTNNRSAWAIKIDSNGVTDNKRRNLFNYSILDTTVKLTHHYNNNYFLSITPNQLLPLTIIKMDSTIGSLCTPATSISISSTASSNFPLNITATVTSIPSITLTTVSPIVTSISNYSIIINSCLPLNTKELNLQNNISLYPNPTSNNLNINNTENFELISCIIFDLNGKCIVSSKNQTMIDVSKLNSGLYFIKIKTDQGEFSQKFIKE